ncbi:glycosyltransferase family 4 protein [Geotalea sp. SG265]|uniref:glycosyltransferase family 4 protein n=1 Tax=Geotalea sp. SG265 TaxID=2922867 RepID=UPI001FB00F6C|nr:glycosyltransferase family 4 protein [Geotalea sp. SG265]
MELPGKSHRIAIVSSSFPPYVTGGISSAHYNLYRLFIQKGYDVKCFTFTDHDLDGTTEEKVVRHGAPKLALKTLGAFYSAYTKLLQTREWFDVADQFPYILVSAIGAWRVGRELLKFRPDILILPDYGSPGFFIPKIPGCKTIFISHHNYLRFIDAPLIGKYSQHDALIAHKIEKMSLNKANMAVCPSTYMEETFRHTHAFDKPIHIIPNLVDYEMINSIGAVDVRSILRLTEASPLIYIPSAGSPIKGARLVFEIIRRLSAAYGQAIGFYLSGDVSDEKLLHELSSLPSYIKVHLPGKLSYEANIATIKACDFCVSPTLLESFGMALLEANFCSLPVISFNIGGVSDIIINGENGYMAAFMDVEQLISFSIGLLTNKARLKALKVTSTKSVNDRFNASIICNLYDKYCFS